MAQRFSISNKQAVLIGLGATAFIAGTIILVQQKKKKKKELEARAAKKNKNSLMV
jgi:hypothetical protein